MTERKEAYRSSPTSRPRRSKSDIGTLRSAIRDLLANDHPMTVRQVFYRLVSRAVIQKTEAEYKQTVCRLLTEMRLRGEIPYGWIADNTRWMRKPPTYGGLEQMLADQITFYRRAFWRDQPVYVEVWLEKDALAGVLYEVTSEWDVPLMVTRGYPSLSYLHEAAQAIRSQGKPAFLYYLGDHDPSGIDIPRNVEARLREMTPGTVIHFQRIAVTRAQIAAWGLPTRPTKATDSRARDFEGESVEVDAIEPSTLRQLVADLIVSHIDTGLRARTMQIEAEERATLWRILQTLSPDRQEEE